MNINDIEDRKKFEEERLYPSLKLLYSGIMGKNALHPIIVGSMAMYLQGIYFDKFPDDIDIIFPNIDDLRIFNFLFKNLCKQYNFTIDFLEKYIGDNYFVIKINDIDIYVATVEMYLKNLLEYNRLWIGVDNERAQKYLNHYNHIKEHYPQYFKEQNPET